MTIAAEDAEDWPLCWYVNWSLYTGEGIPEEPSGGLYMGMLYDPNDPNAPDGLAELMGVTGVR